MPNLFSLLRGKRCWRALFTTVLVCLDHDSLLVMWTPRNLKLQPHRWEWECTRSCFSCSPQSSPLSWSRRRRGCYPGTTRLGLWPTFRPTTVVSSAILMRGISVPSVSLCHYSNYYTIPLNNNTVHLWSLASLWRVPWVFPDQETIQNLVSNGL